MTHISGPLNQQRCVSSVHRFMAAPVANKFTRLRHKYIAACLKAKKLPTQGKILGYTWYGGPNVKTMYIIQLRNLIDDHHSECYGDLDPEEDDPEEDVVEAERRIEEARQIATKFLIDKGYKDFFLVAPLPLIVEYHILCLNGMQCDIGDMLVKRIEDDAKSEKQSVVVMTRKVVKMYQ